MFWENFYRLCNKIGKSPNGVAKELNISSGSITFWKKGKVPHHSTLLKLADYFNVSVDYLLNDNSESKGSPPGEIPRGLDEKTTKAVMKLSRMSDEQKAKALLYIEYLEFQEHQRTQ